jgi:hypothetical protein
MSQTSRSERLRLASSTDSPRHTLCQTELRFLFQTFEASRSDVTERVSEGTEDFSINISRIVEDLLVESTRLLGVAQIGHETESSGLGRCC